jgi:hypothetical protein
MNSGKLRSHTPVHDCDRAQHANIKSVGHRRVVQRTPVEAASGDEPSQVDVHAVSFERPDDDARSAL